jgi:ribosomal protein S18 acetylase RimI-like enzyme
MDDLAPNRVEDLVVETAKAEDVPAIKPMVDAAYSKYIERLGKLPAAMTADYNKLVETQSLYVLRVSGNVVGSILLSRDDDSIKVNNLVVDPSSQGRGYSRVLMDHAEDMARAQDLAAVTLFTNEKMHENITLYRKIGFTETGRKTEDGFNRVFFRKNVL